eukprot:2632933-Rhodomonas_salina.1
MRGGERNAWQSAGSRGQEVKRAVEEFRVKRILCRASPQTAAASGSEPRAASVPSASPAPPAQAISWGASRGPRATHPSQPFPLLDHTHSAAPGASPP